jgi:hypothetical protein
MVCRMLFFNGWNRYCWARSCCPALSNEKFSVPGHHNLPNLLHQTVYTIVLGLSIGYSSTLYVSTVHCTLQVCVPNWRSFCIPTIRTMQQTVNRKLTGSRAHRQLCVCKAASHHQLALHTFHTPGSKACCTHAALQHTAWGRAAGSAM